MITVDKKVAPLKNQEEILKLKNANQTSSLIIQELAPFIQPGITISQLNYEAKKLIQKYSAKVDRKIPTDKGVIDYSEIMSICFGLNSCSFYLPIDNTALKHGDLLITDCSIIKDGWSGDVSKTWIVGQDTTPEKFKLVYTVFEAMQLGISLCKPGKDLYDIAVQMESLVERNGFRMLKFEEDYSLNTGAGLGHSIGKVHNDGWNIPFYKHPINKGRILEEGMTLAIEPLITSGKGKGIINTNPFFGYTEDGAPCAHWENIIEITKDGSNCLSLRSGEL